MSELTAFQVETEKQLNEQMRSIGLTLDNRSVDGSTEVYIAAEVQGAKIWIYRDGACIIGRGVDRVFEKWDFDSSEELREAFVNQVISLFRDDVTGS